MGVELGSRIPSPRRPIDWLLSPLQEFLRIEAAGGILLLACTVIAVVWANSPWADAYHHFWHMMVSVEVGSFTIIMVAPTMTVVSARVSGCCAVWHEVTRRATAIKTAYFHAFIVPSKAEFPPVIAEPVMS